MDEDKICDKCCDEAFQDMLKDEDLTEAEYLALRG